MRVAFLRAHTDPRVVDDTLLNEIATAKSVAREFIMRGVVSNHSSMAVLDGYSRSPTLSRRSACPCCVT